MPGGGTDIGEAVIPIGGPSCLQEWKPKTDCGTSTHNEKSEDGEEAEPWEGLGRPGDLWKKGLIRVLGKGFNTTRHKGPLVKKKGKGRTRNPCSHRQNEKRTKKEVFVGTIKWGVVNGGKMGRGSRVRGSATSRG